MARTTIVFGVLMIALGLAGYVGTGRVSVTALIPAAFGIVLAVLGALSFDERRRKHTMHAAAAVGVVGFLGTAGALVGLLAGGEASRAVIARALMAILMAAFVGLGVRSFIAARKARAGTASEPSRTAPKA